MPEKTTPPPPPPNTVTVDEFTAILGELLKRDEVMWRRLSERDSQLQGQIVELFARSLENQGLDHVLVQGFDHVAKHISAQSAPLRALGKQYAPLNDAAAQMLADLNEALKRQDFSLVPNQGAIGPAQRDFSRAGGVAS